MSQCLAAGQKPRLPRLVLDPCRSSLLPAKRFSLIRGQSPCSHDFNSTTEVPSATQARLEETYLTFAGGERFRLLRYHERPRKRQTVAECSPAQKALQAAVVEKVLRCAEFGVAGAASLGIRGKRVAWRGLTVPRLAAATVTQAQQLARRFLEDGEGWSNPSPGKQFSLVQIPNGGGDQGYSPCP